MVIQGGRHNHLIVRIWEYSLVAPRCHFRRSGEVTVGKLQKRPQSSAVAEYVPPLANPLHDRDCVFSEPRGCLACFLEILNNLSREIMYREGCRRTVFRNWAAVQRAVSSRVGEIAMKIGYPIMAPRESPKLSTGPLSTVLATERLLLTTMGIQKVSVFDVTHPCGPRQPALW